MKELISDFEMATVKFLLRLIWDFETHSYDLDYASSPQTRNTRLATVTLAL